MIAFFLNSLIPLCESTYGSDIFVILRAKRAYGCSTVVFTNVTEFTGFFDNEKVRTHPKLAYSELSYKRFVLVFLLA